MTDWTSNTKQLASGASLEIILELFVGLIAAIAEIAARIAIAVAGFVAMVLEFAFVALTAGITEARARWKNHAAEKQRAATGSDDDDLAPEESSADSVTTGPNHDTSRLSGSKSAGTATVAATVVAGIIVATIAGSLIKHHFETIRKQQIAATEQQLERLADQFEAEIKAGERGVTKRTDLQEHDAWDEPLEASVDEMKLSWFIVVRSGGPDGVRNTEDDQLAIRTLAKRPLDIAKDAGKKGLDGLKNRLKNLLGKDKADDNAE